VTKWISGLIFGQQTLQYNGKAKLNSRLVILSERRGSENGSIPS
jgi:hypothetical protein